MNRCRITIILLFLSVSSFGQSFKNRATNTNLIVDYANSIVFSSPIDDLNSIVISKGSGAKYNAYFHIEPGSNSNELKITPMSSHIRYDTLLRDWVLREQDAVYSPERYRFSGDTIFRSMVDLESGTSLTTYTIKDTKDSTQIKIHDNSAIDVLLKYTFIMRWSNRSGKHEQYFNCVSVNERSVPTIAGHIGSGGEMSKADLEKSPFVFVNFDISDVDKEKFPNYICRPTLPASSFTITLVSTNYSFHEYSISGNRIPDDVLEVIRNQEFIKIFVERILYEVQSGQRLSAQPLSFNFTQ